MGAVLGGPSKSAEGVRQGSGGLMWLRGPSGYGVLDFASFWFLAGSLGLVGLVFWRTVDGGWRLDITVWLEGSHCPFQELCKAFNLLLVLSNSFSHLLEETLSNIC